MRPHLHGPRPTLFFSALLLGCAPEGLQGPQTQNLASELATSVAAGVPGGGPAGSIVFHSKRDGNFEIYSMNSDGGDEVRLTTSAGDDMWPALSPNGEYLAFSSMRTGNREIFVVALRTGTAVNVSNNSGDDDWPRWSHNGRDLVFHTNRNGNYDIYAMAADGSDLRQLTTSSLSDQWPDWSPDGKRIAFKRNMDVAVVDAEGSEQNLTMLTNLPSTLDQMAVWSPNGKMLAFMSLRLGYCSVFVMSADGDTVDDPAVNLTPKGAGDTNASWCSRAPAWSRNGRQIYFASRRPSTGGDFEIFVMNNDGTGVQRLTSVATEDSGPRTR